MTCCRGGAESPSSSGKRTRSSKAANVVSRASRPDPGEASAFIDERQAASESSSAAPTSRISASAHHQRATSRRSARAGRAAARRHPLAGCRQLRGLRVTTVRKALQRARRARWVRGGRAVDGLKRQLPSELELAIVEWVGCYRPASASNLTDVSAKQQYLSRAECRLRVRLSRNAVAPGLRGAGRIRPGGSVVSRAG